MTAGVDVILRFCDETMMAWSATDTVLTAAGVIAVAGNTGQLPGSADTLSGSRPFPMRDTGAVLSGALMCSVAPLGRTMCDWPVRRQTSLAKGWRRRVGTDVHTALTCSISTLREKCLVSCGWQNGCQGIACYSHSNHASAPNPLHPASIIHVALATRQP